MEFCDARFWLAWKDNKCVGRIAGIINPEYNNKTGEKKGRISKVEFIDDKSVSEALFETAENWFREKGMIAVHGPLGFNNLDTQGLLIEGFNYLPSIASVYHKSYYLKHFEDVGYTKENDWVEFRLTLGEHALAKAKRGAELIKKRYGFEVVKFTSTEELKKYVQPVFDILNNAFQDLPYVTPFNSKMIERIGEKYFKILNPKFVKIIRKDERVIAFIIGMPSLSEAMQKINGKLFPFGFYHILKALKQPSVIDLLLTGVDPEYQSTGAAVLLFAELQDEMMKHGITQMETTGMFETNQTAISNWKNFEHIQHKRRRCFVKNL
jgi:GNAT superfamily N-acetyltransferase